MAKKHPLDVYREAERSGRSPAGWSGTAGGAGAQRQADEEREPAGRRHGTGRSRTASGRRRAAPRGLWLEDLSAAASALSGTASLVVGGTIVILLAGAFAIGYVTGHSGGPGESISDQEGSSPSSLQVRERWPGSGETTTGDESGQDPGRQATAPPPGSAGSRAEGRGEKNTPAAESGAWRVRVEIYDRGNASLAEHWCQILSEAGFADAIVLPVADGPSGATALRLYVGQARSKNDLAGLLDRIKRFEDPSHGGKAFVNAGVEYVVIDSKRPPQDAAKDGS